MFGDSGSIKYSLREPFERAVESVWRSLSDRGLLVTGQVDVSRRVERALGIALPPCTILLVLPKPSSPSWEAVHPWAASFLPLHVVISESGLNTEIQIQNRVQTSLVEASSPLYGPAVETRVLVGEAIDAIAMRPSLVV